MKNYRIEYTYDGYRFYDVVSAESAEQAIGYFVWLDCERHNCLACETNEDPSYVVPAGWQRPLPLDSVPEDERVLFDLYTSWAWDRCNELGLDPEDCDVDYKTWLREVHCNAN